MIGSVLLAGALPGAVRAKRRTAHPYRRAYVKETFGKRALAGTAARAALGRRHGFGQNLARGLAAHVINNSIEYPVAAARHEDLHYYRSTRRGAGPRLKHALVSTVVTRKTTSGRKTVAAGRLAGAAGSAAIVGGAASGGLTLAGAAGMNVAREFWPRRKHKLRARR